MTDEQLHSIWSFLQTATPETSRFLVVVADLATGDVEVTSNGKCIKCMLEVAVALSGGYDHIKGEDSFINMSMN